jgi:glutamine amidotransferase PdxT
LVNARGTVDRPMVGILALQGDFEAHAKMLTRLGAESREVRVPADLDGLDALIVPGGESTVMTLGPPVHAVFIRAPWIAEHGSKLKVLAEIDGHPVAVRQDKLIAISFHPELSGESRLHELLLSLISE